MNCRPENHRLFIVLKANSWEEIANRGINKEDRAWARRNYRRLVRAHPKIFAAQEPTGESAEASAGPPQE
jgi:hypothetical protein